MTRPRRLLFLCMLGACLGMLLALVDRRARAKPSADSGSGESKPVLRANSAAESKQDESVSTHGDQPPEDASPARKAAYITILAALDGVQEAAVKKFGRRPRPDDTAGFTIPYKAFVNTQTQRVRKQLARDLGLSEFAIDQIKVEGDHSGWPKR